LSVPVNATEAQVRDEALRVEEQVERQKKAALVQRLRDLAGHPGGLAVTGLASTLQALAERRVDVLVVSEGYEVPGWRCHGCGYLAAKGRTCPVCQSEMELVDDVVEQAVEDALNQSCKVTVCVGNADLDVLGRVGALLRF
jgi:peptide subunit release factor 1 (eRF1)